MSARIQRVNIHQQATFRYLMKIKSFCENELDLSPLQHHKDYSKLITIIEQIKQLPTEYQNNNDYAKLYLKYHNAIEKVAKKELNDETLRTNSTLLDPLYIRTFENQNNIHDFVFDNIINEGQVEIKENLQVNLKKKTTGRSKFDIRHPDNPLNAFFASMLGGFDYNPLKRNNVPYVAFEQNRLTTNRKCLRIGAQTRDSGYVNDTFQRYLLANNRMRKQLTPQNPVGQYDYVYISLMKTEEHRQDVQKEGLAKRVDQFVRYSEGSRAAAIESLNLAKDLRTAAITLPADGGFFLGNFSMSHGKGTHHSQTNMQTLAKQVIESIKNDRNDFSMSKDVKKVLFGEKFDGRIIEQLLKNAMGEVILGAKGKNLKDINLNDEQRNAVLFQFVKSNLSNYILEMLNPCAYNMSCKDAIDRGGIHTLWYHMNLLAKQGKPMTKEEFFKFLDTPAMIVKYRGLNNNRNLLLNVMKHRLEADPIFRAQHAWAEDWVAVNLRQIDTNFDVKKSTPMLDKLENILSVESVQKPASITLETLNKAMSHAFKSSKQLNSAKQCSEEFSYSDFNHIRVPVMVRC